MLTAIKGKTSSVKRLFQDT